MKSTEQKRLLELQMEELKATYGIKKDPLNPEKKTSNNDRSANSEKIAKLYEDAAEYEEDLKCFEEELSLIHANSLEDIPSILSQKFPNYEGDYLKELSAVLQNAWTGLVDVEKTHPQEQLLLIKKTSFCDVIEKLNTQYPEYTGDFKTEIRDILVKRWEMLIGIKKEHVAEELAEMKLRGMKPDHIRKVYQKFHGLES